MEEFREWFDGIRKEKFPDLWDESINDISCYSHSYESDSTLLKEKGDKYISFLEELVETMFIDLMKNKVKE